jgi:hypothetical protein
MRIVISLVVGAKAQASGLGICGTSNLYFRTKKSKKGADHEI